MQTVPLALEHFRRGGLVLLIDPAGNGHLVLAAERARVAEMALMKSAGVDDFILALTAAEMPRLVDNPDLPKSEVVPTREGGLLQYEGTPEAAADFARLSGLAPQSLVRALRPQDLWAFAERHEVPVVTIEDLTLYRRRTEAVLELVAVADLPTRHALQPFRAYSYRSSFDGV